MASSELTSTYKVKFVQIAAINESDNTYPYLLGLDQNGQMWRCCMLRAGMEWERIPMPGEVEYA